MDANPTFPLAETPEPSVPSRRKSTAALAVSALVLCTACGAVGGLAIGEAIHGSSDGNTAANGSGFPMVNRSRPDFGYQTQQSGTQETTSTATGSQLVGLVRLQVTLGYQNGAAVGTGMILNSTGKVVTNHHVIEGATKILATDMSTGKRYVATLVGSDSSDDIAVLQLQGASGLATVHPSTATAAVGQTVTAVGDAQGATTLTASPGKVTALNQTISPSDSSSAQNETLTGIIQYAADVMSGDSGGATYDSSGSVIGMTTAASAGGMQTNGYAIPISKVLSVATDLGNSVANTKYVYGLPAFIGVGVSQSDVVEQVYAGTGAATSGLVPGDRIVAIDGTTISNASQLQAATRQRQVGDTLQVTWTTSADKRHSATIRLISGPAR